MTILTIAECNQLSETLTDLMRSPAKVKVKLSMMELIIELKNKTAAANELLSSLYKQHGKDMGNGMLSMEVTSDAFRQVQELNQETVEITHNLLDIESIADMQSNTDCRVLMNLLLSTNHIMIP
jgi:hypothetical protein